MHSMTSNLDELFHTLVHLHQAYHSFLYIIQCKTLPSSMTRSSENALHIMSTNRNLDLSKLMLQRITQILEQSAITEDVQQHL